MKKWLFAVLLGSVLVLGACGGDNDNNADNNTDNSGNNTENVEDNGNAGGDTASAAEQIYEDNCASCHGADLAGGGGPDLTAVGADYSSDEIVDIIQNGKGGMPAINVGDDDAQTLADWLAEKQ